MYSLVEFPEFFEEVSKKELLECALVHLCRQCFTCADAQVLGSFENAIQHIQDPVKGYQAVHEVMMALTDAMDASDVITLPPELGFLIKNLEAPNHTTPNFVYLLGLCRLLHRKAANATRDARCIIRQVCKLFGKHAPEFATKDVNASDQDFQDAVNKASYDFAMRTFVHKGLPPRYWRQKQNFHYRNTQHLQHLQQCQRAQQQLQQEAQNLKEGTTCTHENASCGLNTRDLLEVLSGKPVRTLVAKEESKQKEEANDMLCLYSAATSPPELDTEAPYCELRCDIEPLEQKKLQTSSIASDSVQFPPPTSEEKNKAIKILNGLIIKEINANEDDQPNSSINHNKLIGNNNTSTNKPTKKAIIPMATAQIETANSQSNLRTLLADTKFAKTECLRTNQKMPEEQHSKNDIQSKSEKSSEYVPKENTKYATENEIKNEARSPTGT